MLEYKINYLPTLLFITNNQSIRKLKNIESSLLHSNFEKALR